jgi:hypothetical protein
MAWARVPRNALSVLSPCRPLVHEVNMSSVLGIWEWTVVGQITSQRVAETGRAMEQWKTILIVLKIAARSPRRDRDNSCS